MSELCRSCRAPIRWVRMAASGRPNPLDPEPSERGNIVILEDGRGLVVIGARLEERRAQGVPLYLSHFVTCPDRERHRRPRQATAA